MVHRSKYSYNPGIVPILLGGAFFAVCAFLLYQEMQENDSLTIDQIIELSPNAARPVFWSLFLFSLCFCLASLLAIFRAVTRKGEIVLDATTLVVPPAPIRTEPRIIPVVDITALSRFKVRFRQYLRLQLRQGHLDLNIGNFEDVEAYDRFEHDLKQAISVGR